MDSIINSLNSIKDSISVVNTLLNQSEAQFSQVTDRIFSIENYVTNEYNNVQLSRYTTVDEYSNVVIDAIQPDVVKPVITYPTPNYAIQNLTNIPIKIDLQQFFQSSTNDILVYRISVTDIIRPNLYRNSNLYDLNEKMLTLYPDYRGITYNIIAQTVDKTYENYLSIKYLSEKFTITITENPVPPIRASKTISLSFTNVDLNPQIIQLDVRSFAYIDINFDYKAIFLSFDLAFDDLEYNPIQAFINDNNELLVVPNFRGTSYKLNIKTTDSIYRTYQSTVILVTEPAPVITTREIIVFKDLSNVPLTIHLDDYFRDNTLSNNTIYYEYISPIVDYAHLSQSNVLQIIPNYRNSTNIINVFGYILPYANQKTRLDISITEKAALNPLLIQNRIEIKSLFPVTCNLNDFFISTSPDLIYRIVNSYDSSKFNIVYSNLNVIPVLNQDVKTYDIFIQAYDPIYNKYSLQNLNVFLQEYPVIIRKPLRNFLGLSNQIITLDLYDYFQSPINSDLNFFFNINKTLNNNPIVIDNSNLVITPFYRNTTYFVTIYAYDYVNYPQFISSYPSSFSIQETLAPPPYPSTSNLKILLTDTRCNLDLNTIWRSVINSPLRYFELPIDNEKYSVVGSNLVLTPSLRNIKYDVEIIAIDSLYDIYSIEKLVINVTEISPIIQLKALPSLSNLTRDPVVLDLSEYFISYLSNTIIYTYSISQTLRTNLINPSLDIAYIYSNIFILYPDYREVSYDISIFSADIEYSNLVIENKISVTEPALTSINPIQPSLNISTLYFSKQTFNLYNYFISPYFELTFQLKSDSYRSLEIPFINLIYDKSRLYYADFNGNITIHEIKLFIKNTLYIVAKSPSVNLRVRNTLEDIHIIQSDTQVLFKTDNVGVYSYGSLTGREVNVRCSRRDLSLFMYIENNLLYVDNIYDQNFPIHVEIDCFRKNFIKPFNETSLIINKPDLIFKNISSLSNVAVVRNIKDVLDDDYVNLDLYYVPIKTHYWIEHTDNVFIVYPDFRGSNYDVVVSVYDKNNNLLSDVTYTINEITSVVINTTTSSNFLSLTDNSFNLNLRSFFINNTPDNHVFNCYVSNSNIRRGFYNSNLPNFIFDNNSNLQIIPEYRNTTYYIYVNTYIENYQYCNITQTLTINESKIPSINLISNSNTTFYGLTSNVIELDMYKYFDYVYFQHATIFPVVKNLNKTPIRTFIPPYVITSNQHLIIKPDYNDIIYNLNVQVYDSNFGINNTSLNYSISEKTFRGDKWFHDIYFLSNQPLIDDVTYLDLKQYFYSDIKYFNVQYKDVIPRDAYYRSDTKAFVFDSNILKIFPEYRNLTYNLIITAGLSANDLQPNIIEIIIAESNIPPIQLEYNSPTSFSNLINNICNIDLSVFFQSYPYVDRLTYTYEVPTLPSNRKPYNIIISQSNLLFEANVRDVAYDIHVVATDNRFNISNSNLYFNIHELPPFQYKNISNIDVLNLTDISYQCNLEDLFVPITNTYLVFSNIYPTLRDGFYNNKPALELTQSNIFYIHPEFRNTSYSVDFIVYMHNYESQPKPFRFNASERLITPITLKSNVVRSFSNLTKIDISCNLYDYFEYHYLNKLQFASNVSTSNHSSYFSSSNILVISPDIRNNYYTISINAFDPNFNINNQSLIFNVQEKSPIELYDLQYKNYFSNLSNISKTLDLNKLFINNWQQSNILFTITDSNVYDMDPYYHRCYYNSRGGCNILEFAQPNLTINPEYRGDLVNKYNIHIQAHLENYSYYTVNHVIYANELPLPRLIGSSNFNLYNLSNNAININLRSIINSNYPFFYNIDFNPVPTIPNIYPQIINKTTLYHKADLRGSNGVVLPYKINVTAFDPYYFIRSCNQGIQINISELPPLSNYIKSKTISNLTQFPITCNLDSLFVKGLSPCNILYDIRLSTNVLDGFYNNLPPILSNYNNLTIIPEYRKQFIDSYNIIIDARLDGYPHQSNQFTFNILEDNIVPIKNKISLVSTANLNEELVVCNLRSYFDYPYVSSLDFQYSISTPLNSGSKPYDVNIRESSNLYIKANARLQTYDIRIIAHDAHFNINNSNLLITVREEGPLSFKSGNTISISGLTRYTCNINLDSFFNVNLANVDLGYIPYFPDLRRGYYNNNLPAFEITSTSNLHLYPEYRNSNYNIQFDAFIVGYEQQTIRLTLNITENRIPDIKIINPNSIIQSNIIIDRLQYNLRDIYASYDYVQHLRFECNIITPLQTGRKPYNVSIINESNLVVQGDVRDQYYEVRIIAHDDAFNTSNSAFISRFQERHPLDYRYSSNVVPIKDLTSNLYAIALDTFFNINYPTGDIGYIASYPSLRAGYYNGGLPVAEIVDTSNLYLHPEYRNSNYNIDIDAFVVGYESQKRRITYNITERQIPDIELDNPNIYIQNLNTEVLLYTLTDYFSRYPYVSYLSFKTQILNNLKTGSKEFDVSIISGNQLRIKANVRNQYYQVQVIATDDNFNIYNNFLIMRFVENAPLYSIPNPVISFTNLSYIPLQIDLSPYFVINVPSGVLFTDKSLPSPSQRNAYYINKPIFELSTNVFTVNPEYRNKTYSVTIYANVVGYESQSITIRFTFTEIQIPAIVFTGTNIVENNLIVQTLQYNLSGYFTSYPFSNQLIFTYTLNHSLLDIRQDYNINIVGSNLIVKADVRDSSYSISIKARDSLFNQENNVMTASFQEEPPFYITSGVSSYNFFNLTDIQRIIYLDDYFTINYPSGDIQYLLTYPTLRTGFYNGGLPAIQLQSSSNLVLNPEYRNTSYQIKATSHVIGYASQSIDLFINVSEDSISSINLTDPDIRESNLIINEFLYDLRTYYNTYTYPESLVFTFDIPTPLLQGRKPFLVELQQESNLYVKANVRDQYYEIHVTATDPNYSLTNTNLIMRFHESPPLSLKFSSNIYETQNLSDMQYSKNLDDYFTINYPFGDIRYEYSYPSLRNGFYNGKLDAIQIINNSNISIHPEYRGSNYQISVTSYVIGYETQPIYITLDITECNIPDILFNNQIVNQTNLKQERCNYDLRTYYYGFPYIDKLSFDFNILDPILQGRRPFDVSIASTSNLSVKADVRFQSYRVQIIATDLNFNINNNSFTLSFTELQPFIKIASINNLTGLEYTSVDVTLSDKYQSYVIGGVFDYQSNVVNLPSKYANDTVINISSDVLTVFPRYRDSTYQVVIVPFIVGYEYYKDIVDTISVTEIANPLSSGEVVVNIILSNLQTIKDFKTDLGLSSAFNLFELYDISSDVSITYNYENAKDASIAYEIQFIDNGNQRIIYNPFYIGKKYEIDVILSDKKDNANQSKIKYVVDEKPPIDTLIELSQTITNLSNQSKSITLNDYFIGTELMHEVTCNMNGLNLVGYHKKTDAIHLTDGILTINADYRGGTYDIYIKSYKNGYVDQHLSNHIVVNEIQLPLLEFIVDPISISGLTVYAVVCNLNTISSYLTYPYPNDILYKTYYINSSIYNTSNLYIYPNLRNDTFDVYVEIYDINIVQKSCNLMFYVQEKPPIEQVNPFPVYVDIGPPSYTIDISSIYVINHPTSNKDVIVSSKFDNVIYADNNITVQTQYRGEEYKIDVVAFVLGYESYRLSNQISLTETANPFNNFTLTIYHSLMSYYQTIENSFQQDIGFVSLINLYSRYYIESSTTVLSTTFPSYNDPLCNITYLDDTALDSHKILFTGKLLGYTYQIDILFKNRTTNETEITLIYVIEEYPPIDFKGIPLSYGPLAPDDVCNLRFTDFFKSNHSDPISYKIRLSNIDRIAPYYNQYSALVVDGVSILDALDHAYASDKLFEIHPEYRGIYDLILTATMQNFENQSNVQTIVINERSLPLLVDIISPKNLLNLTTERYQSNLYDIFNIASFDYYYKQSLLYELKFDVISGTRIDNVKTLTSLQQRSNLVIQANLNDIQYVLYYSVRDQYFTDISNVGIMNISEKAPLEFDSTISRSYNILSASVCNLDIYFTKNKNNTIMASISNIGLSDLYNKGVYNGKDSAAYIINNNQLQIIPEYRGKTYDIYISIWLDQYASQSNVYNFSVTEETLPQISVLDVNRDYLIYNDIVVIDIPKEIEYVYRDYISYSILASNVTHAYINNCNVISIIDDNAGNHYVDVEARHQFRDIERIEQMTYNVNTYGMTDIIQEDVIIQII